MAKACLFSRQEKCTMIIALENIEKKQLDHKYVPINSGGNAIKNTLKVLTSEKMDMVYLFI